MQQKERSKTAVAILMLVLSGSLPAEGCLTSRGHTLQGEIESRCESLESGGLERSYRVYVPAHLAQPAPVVLVLHGGGGSGGGQELVTNAGFNRIADREGILVLYPDGIGRNWNDGRSQVNSEAARENVDDVGFLRALVEEIGREHEIDRRRIFVTGMSNGGFMSFRLACDAADLFRAAAPVVAGLAADLGPRCKPSRPVSIAIMNGTDDPLVPWQGGDVKVLWMTRGATWSAMQSYEKWIELDGCHVRFDEIRGGGHNWPRGAKYLGESMVGRITQEFDGSEEIWSFFKSVSKQ